MSECPQCIEHHPLTVDEVNYLGDLGQLLLTKYSSYLSSAGQSEGSAFLIFKMGKDEKARLLIKKLIGD